MRVGTERIELAEVVDIGSATTVADVIAERRQYEGYAHSSSGCAYDTVVISALVWGRKLDFDNYVTVVLTSYVIKLAAAILVTPVIYALHALIERRFGIPPAAPDVDSADIAG